MLKLPFAKINAAAKREKMEKADNNLTATTTYQKGGGKSSDWFGSGGRRQARPGRNYVIFHVKLIYISLRWDRIWHLAAYG